MNWRPTEHPVRACRDNLAPDLRFRSRGSKGFEPTGVSFPVAPSAKYVIQLSVGKGVDVGKKVLMSGTNDSSTRGGKVPPRPGKAAPRPANWPSGSGVLGPRVAGQAKRALPRRVVPRHRRRNTYIASVGGVLVVIVAFVMVGVLGANGSGANGGKTAPDAYPIPADLLAQVERVPVSDLVRNAEEATAGGARPPEKLPSSAPRLSSGGHPEIIFVCAEYWRLCADERWPMVMALSKFGTFSKLSRTTSSSVDKDPNTPTFSFYGVKYTSKYLTIVTDEEETSAYNSAAGEYPLLQAPTLQELRLINTWDVAPYSTEDGLLPFAYIGGRFLQVGAQYDASAISNRKFKNAVAIMTSGKSSVSKDAEAAAGYLIGDLCALTQRQSVPVCSHVPPKLVGTGTSPAPQAQVRGHGSRLPPLRTAEVGANFGQ